MDDLEGRKEWMGLLARAPAELLAERWESLASTPHFSWLRAPEIGGVMVQGRTGAKGAPFNLGEMTVTRCSLRLESGEVGHGYVQGRDKRKAETAALCDAMMQTEASSKVRKQVLTPIAEAMEATKIAREKKAAGTKVDFFTMVRGED